MCGSLEMANNSNLGVNLVKSFKEGGNSILSNFCLELLQVKLQTTNIFFSRLAN